MWPMGRNLAPVGVRGVWQTAVAVSTSSSRSYPPRQFHQTLDRACVWAKTGVTTNLFILLNMLRKYLLPTREPI